MDLQVGQYHTRNATGIEVRITQVDTIVTKDDSDARWHEAVAFQRSDDTNDPPLTYVRKRADFEAKYCQSDCPTD